MKARFQKYIKDMKIVLLTICFLKYTNFVKNKLTLKVKNLAKKSIISNYIFSLKCILLFTLISYLSRVTSFFS